MIEEAASVGCPGCGVVLQATAAPRPDGFNASGECFERYGELSAYTLSVGDPNFPHQFAVDAYAAQHAGPASKPITTFFALVGLCLACDHGLPGHAVQGAHIALAERKRDWPRFTAPASMGPITVLNVLEACPGSARHEALRTWAASVWQAWRDQHARIGDIVAEWLPGQSDRFEHPKGRGK